MKNISRTAATNDEINDVFTLTDKYKQIILNCIKYGSDDDGKITKTKLAKLVYLADFIWYYLNLRPMANVNYRKLDYGPVSDLYFRALDEMEESGTIIRETRGKAFMFSLVEKEPPKHMLSDKELTLIMNIGDAWRNQSTDDIVNFTHKQLPWQICNLGEIIPFELITQEEPEQVYGTVKI